MIDMAHTQPECNCKTPRISSADRDIAAREYDRAALARAEKTLPDESRFVTCQRAIHRVFGAEGAER